MLIALFITTPVLTVASVLIIIIRQLLQRRA
jgi:hypothetical protein